MTDGDPIRAVIVDAGLPEWVADVRVQIMVDASGDVAADVQLVVGRGHDAVLSRGEALNAVRRRIQEAVDGAGIQLWPYVRFVAEAEAA